MLGNVLSSFANGAVNGMRAAPTILNAAHDSGSTIGEFHARQTRIHNRFGILAKIPVMAPACPPFATTGRLMATAPDFVKFGLILGSGAAGVASNLVAKTAARFASDGASRIMSAFRS